MPNADVATATTEKVEIKHWWTGKVLFTADDVPGAPGIGPKTAAKLINRWGSLDALYLSVWTGWTDHVLTPRLARILLDNQQQVFLSRELVRLDRGPYVEARL